MKKTTGKLNVCRKKYSPELYQFVKSESAEHMYYFGYTNLDDNPYAFFNFSHHTAANQAIFQNFQKDNEIALKQVCSPDFKQNSNVFYPYKTKSTFPMFDGHTLANMLNTVGDKAQKDLQAA